MDPLIVAASIGSLNWTCTLPLVSTPVALGDGVRPLIVGAVVSAPGAYPIETSLSTGVLAGSPLFSWARYWT